MSHIIVTIITTNHLFISDSPGLDERLHKFIFSMSCINCQLKRYKYKYKCKCKYKYKYRYKYKYKYKLIERSYASLPL